jgi:Ca2+-binding RTX toxin-like protein
MPETMTPMPGEDLVTQSIPTMFPSRDDASAAMATDLPGGNGADDLLADDRVARVLKGSGADDTLTGAGGSDDLQGGKGNDHLAGRSGDDSLKGGKGSDVLSGDQGDDRLFGENGQDRLEGGSGSDMLDGGKDDDHVSGDAGNDILKGGKGNDILSGGADDDSLFGGNGADWLDGGSGADQLHGGKGHDTFVFGDDDTILDFDRDDDLIDLRGLGVNAGNFDDLVTIERDWTGTRVKVGDAEIAVLGEDHLSMDDFVLDAPASSQRGAMPADIDWSATISGGFAGASEQGIEQAMMQQMLHQHDLMF